MFSQESAFGSTSICMWCLDDNVTKGNCCWGQMGKMSGHHISTYFPICLLFKLHELWDHHWKKKKISDHISIKFVTLVGCFDAKTNSHIQSKASIVIPHIMQGLCSKCPCNWGKSANEDGTPVLYRYHSASNVMHIYPALKRTPGVPGRLTAWQHFRRHTKVLLIPLPDSLVFPGTTHSWASFCFKCWHMQQH